MGRSAPEHHEQSCQPGGEKQAGGRLWNGGDFPIPTVIAKERLLGRELTIEHDRTELGLGQLLCEPKLIRAAELTHHAIPVGDVQGTALMIVGGEPENAATAAHIDGGRVLQGQSTHPGGSRSPLRKPVGIEHATPHGDVDRVGDPVGVGGIAGQIEGPASDLKGGNFKPGIGSHDSAATGLRVGAAGHTSDGGRARGGLVGGGHRALVGESHRSSDVETGLTSATRDSDQFNGAMVCVGIRQIHLCPTPSGRDPHPDGSGVVHTGPVVIETVRVIVCGAVQIHEPFILKNVMNGENPVPTGTRLVGPSVVGTETEPTHLDAVPVHVDTFLKIGIGVVDEEMLIRAGTEGGAQTPIRILIDPAVAGGDPVIGVVLGEHARRQTGHESDAKDG